MIHNSLIRALRTADAICFDSDPDGQKIRAIIRGADYNHERTIEVPVESSTVQNYGPGGERGYRCFAMIMSAKYDNVWQTVARHITPSCEIHFRWTRNNASPVTDEAGIVVDYLDVVVHNTRTGKADTYRMATFIGLDNSARMVRLA